MADEENTPEETAEPVPEAAPGVRCIHCLHLVSWDAQGGWYHVLEGLPNAAFIPGTEVCPSGQNVATPPKGTKHG